MLPVLIATSNTKACDVICSSLAAAYKADVVGSPDICIEAFKKKRYELTFLDISFLHELRRKGGYRFYQEVLQLFWKQFPTATLIVIAPQERIREAVEVVKAGAANYLTYPLDAVELNYVIESVRESDRLESELDYLRSNFWQKESLELVRTKSLVMKEVFEKIMAVAPTRTTVLLTGETGTGKGVMAKLIHTHSNRKEKLFVSVHCGAIPDNLVESELFGHEKGAFTGAIRRKLGKFEVARGGTILLDEIGTISPSVQVKLLHVLQERTLQRVGGEETIDCDVRVIAASNMDLKRLCDEGIFRRDLYYRLNVFPIEVPPLRTRVEDIPLLAEMFLQRLNKLYSKEIRSIHLEVISALEQYAWPGNIREMEHLIERAYILEKTSILTTHSFPMELFASGNALTPIHLNTSLTLAESRRKAIAEFELHYLKKILTEHRGKIGKTAQASGVTPRQLHKLMKKHCLNKKDFK